MPEEPNPNPIQIVGNFYLILPRVPIPMRWYLCSPVIYEVAQWLPWTPKERTKASTPRNLLGIDSKIAQIHGSNLVIRKILPRQLFSVKFIS